MSWSPGPTDWRGQRRWAALTLRREDGLTQAAIAQALGVSQGMVSRWLARADQDGEPAVVSHPRRGACSRLSPEQFRLIPDFLSHGAEAYGFHGEVWTCTRVAQVIEEEFAVRYHKAHVSRLLEKLNWTPQMPLERASQRDEQEIERWRIEVWPQAKKKAAREGRKIVFIDESGFYLLPARVRTYAPIAHTPILKPHETYDHWSVMGGLTTSGQLYTQEREVALNSFDSVSFLMHLLSILKKKLLVIWDGSPIHRKEVNRFMQETGSEYIHIERLPPYAPDLNPVEWVWRHLKHVELRNVVCQDLLALRIELNGAIARLRSKPRLFPSFFAGAKLPL